MAADADPPGEQGAPPGRAPAGPRTGVMTATEVVAMRHPELDGAALGGRYALGGKLGRGGMGVVFDAYDRRLGRRVAVKRLSGAATPAHVERFVREARVQGRLDHPAVVPVYDLGIQSDGRPYFAMRRLEGVTLLEVIHRQAAGDPDALARWPRVRLLEVLVAVCLAIEHAHARGVVHRDLKPANVVLGDLGEVYVIDWGVAQIEGEDLPVPEGETVGTVGYMAPEQRAGAAVDGRADVYALGCVLFELLAGEPLHPPGGALAADEPAPRPGARAPAREVPAELDAVCARALAPAPGDRFGRPRDLAEAIERHLDADREAAVRLADAARLAARARAALAAPGALDDADARAAAMRDAGRALALDPGHGDAAAVVRDLLLEPPARLPAPIADAVAADDARAIREQARTIGLSYLGVFLLVPVILWQGVQDWSFLALVVGGSAALMALGLAAARGALARAWVWLLAGGNAVLLIALSRFLGPFVIPPAIAVIVAMAAVSHPGLRAWWLVPPLVLAGPLGALALEETGVLARTVHGAGDGLVLTASVVGLPPAATVLGVVGSIAALLVVAANFARRTGEVQHGARRRLARQAAHLRRLVDPRSGA